LCESSSGLNVVECEHFMAMNEMVFDALRQHEIFESSYLHNMDEHEHPNEEDQRFYNLLLEANKPLFKGVTDSKLSVCARLLASKSNWNVPDQCLDFVSKLFLDITPTRRNCQKIILMLRG